ncbi:MAG: VTC domain-containing protein [Saprospiraceae bacterium]
MRHERKYRIDDVRPEQVVQAIRLNPVGFITSYPDRWVNNIYFDSIDFSKLRENRDGISKRVKIRYRWYGPLENYTKGVLEFKMKENLLGKKEKRELDLHGLEDLNDIVQKIEKVTQAEKPLLPVLINRYKRKYFEAKGGKFRITVDEHLKFYPIFERNLSTPFSEVIEADESDWIKENACILEFKYPSDGDTLVDTISQNLPFRMTKFSKFATGLQKSVGISV